MFNWLKKAQARNLIADFIEQKKLSNKSMTEIVEEIHDNFYTAADRLLKHANKIISNPTIDNDYLELSKIGFSSSKQVVPELKKQRLIDISNEIVKDIVYYQQTYPQWKFIIEGEVKRICKKYGLLFGNSNNYIGDIPRKNAKEIANFNKQLNTIKDKDRLVDYRYKSDWIDSRGKEHIYSYQNEYKICAPVKDMRLEWYEQVKDGWKVEVDPVVLFPVRGGYFIVSAWGDEASDEAIVNQKMN